MSRRIASQLEVTTAAKRLNVRVADGLGMTQVATVSRLVEWFVALPPELQDDVIDSRPDATFRVLARMARPAR